MQQHHIRHQKTGCPYAGLQRAWIFTVIVVGQIILANSAQAWGPKTQLAIVSNSLRMLAKEGNIPVARIEKDLYSGALVSLDMLKTLYPTMASNPIRAIENEMRLLQKTASINIDPYFAYRMGTLGKLVAYTTSPLSKAPVTFQGLYYTDADKQIGNTTLKIKAREIVEPDSYFNRRIEEANFNNTLIISEYKSGNGFNGFAKEMMANDTSRSTNAVADVWFTIFTHRAPGNGVSDDQLRDYVRRAMDFYVQRQNPKEITNAQARLSKLVTPTTQLHIDIGNLFYDAEMYEFAMAQYEEALKGAPDNRSVIQKMADYYVLKGNEALENKQLEKALEHFEKAKEINPLHPTVEDNRLNAMERKDERDKLLAQYQGTLQQAGDLVTLAEQETLRSRFAEAAALLRQAKSIYQEVGDEFVLEAQQRDRALNDIRIRLIELKSALMENATQFSGRGIEPDIQAILREEGRTLDSAALEAILQEILNQEIENLKDRLWPTLQVQ